MPYLLALLLLADVGALRTQLQQDDARARFAAAEAAGRMGKEGRVLLPELIDLLGDDETFNKLAAARAIASVGLEEKHVESIIGRLEWVPAEVSLLLGEALAAQPASVPALLETLEGKRSRKASKRLRREAMRALWFAGPKAAAALPRAIELSTDRDAALQRVARETVRRLGGWSGRCVPELTVLLIAEHPDQRWLAARMLAQAGPAAKTAIPALKRAMEAGDERVAKAAAEALKQIDVAVQGPREGLRKPQAAKQKAPDRFTVRFETTQGPVELAIERALAPKGVDRFYNLVRLGFFDDTAFFRVLPGFVVQWGLHGDPKVNNAWKDATIEDDPVRTTNARGTICFAMAGPNTRTTQMFINLRNNRGLDKQGFSPFGRVTKGLEVIEKLFAGYREQPDQQMITYEGNAYLKRAWPKLDRIKTARVVP